MENLRQLLAAYFHQDWHDEYDGSWESAVDDFVRRESDRAPGARDEISQLLAEGGSEGALPNTLDCLGSYYWAGDEPRDYRDWLLAVKARIEGGLSNSGNP